ncbi:MAG: tetrathionate reductase subunit TtrA [Deltaproteobacteria bacterium]|jgi:tetrathionate reductase subunit A|nr:tetrathionate reductase subunit TtrA [Deltaproteobacteria bacterium]
MKLSRREIIAACGLAAGAAGLSGTVGKIVRECASSDKAEGDKISGLAPEPEFVVDKETGDVSLNPGQQVSYTVCMGCTTLCGVRVRADKATGKILRVAGNPYNPLSAARPLAMETSVKKSFAALSRFQDMGLDGRATACGRGNAIMEYMDSPLRVLKPLKRSGPRNSGRWQEISFEQLIKELTTGGNLFNEGHVQGLAELRDLQTPLDENAPEFGPKVNQVGVLSSVNEGREALAVRFWNQAYGTQNFARHGAYCGGSYRSGSGALFGDLRRMPHGKPDISNAEFVIFIGTAPGNAGNPFKRTGNLVAGARSEGELEYVVVDPVLTNADNRACNDRSRWVPIRPGTDGALIMGMIRWMLENNRVNIAYLSCPNQDVAKRSGEPSFTSASWLVITADGHARCGRYLRGSDIGIGIPDDKRYSGADPYMALDANGQLVIAAAAVNPAQILPLQMPVQYIPQGEDKQPVDIADMKLKTALQLLHEAAFRHSLDEYSDACGIPKDIITGLARKFTDHGRKASAVAHGGMMSGNGFYNAYGVVTLNALIGNVNWKGGFVMNGGPFKDVGNGPQYNLTSFEGQVKPRGMPIGRNVAFERTSEFKRTKAEGKPYPARDAWFPNAPALSTEWLPAMLRGYPYSLKALILWICNPLYGVPGLSALVKQDLADPKKIPLIVSVDTMINESNAFADYIVPDSLMYECWGWIEPWNGVPTKTMSARWPVIEPKMAKTPEGRPISMETFVIALAKAMDLPGFGPKGLTDAQGNHVSLECPEDWYFRGGANIAFMGQKPIGDATEEDLHYSGVHRMREALESKLKPDEWRKVAFLYTRGGRFQPADQAQDQSMPDWQTNRFNRVLWIWNENVGSSLNSLSGARFWGCAQWLPPGFADGSAMRKHYPEKEWPMLLVSFKSPLHNACSIATSLGVLRPDNPMLLHPRDAAEYGLSIGDIMKVITPGGTVQGKVIVHSGVMRGVVGIEHGYGHKELGVRQHVINGIARPCRLDLPAGININDIGLTDPSRGNQAVWVDGIAGSAVRNGLPAKIARA